MAIVKYHYAIDENNNLVNIDDIVPADRKNHKYFCFFCGAEMIVKAGEIREKHFAHKIDQENCSYESYLHKLAKRLLREKFNNNQQFTIQLYQEIQCAKFHSCELALARECREQKMMEYDIKSLYDTCKEEQLLDNGNFIADLLITNSTIPEREPILIEIHVSHKSTHKKIHSRYKIIEIRLRDDFSLYTILNGPITETERYFYDRYQEKERISFYNFKDKTTSKSTLRNRNISRFILYSSGKPFVENDYSRTHCDNILNKLDKRSVLELSIDDKDGYISDSDAYDYGLFEAMKRGIQIKNCAWCKWLKFRQNWLGDYESICCLYKKCGTPRNPNYSDAIQCNHYKLNKEKYREVEQTYPNITIIEANHT